MKCRRNCTVCKTLLTPAACEVCGKPATHIGRQGTSHRCEGCLSSAIHAEPGDK